MSTSALQVGLFASLGATVVVLAIAMWLAKQHRIKAHIGGVVGFLVLFGVTLVFAETLGRRYDFAEPAYTIHLTLAFTATALAVVTVGTGIYHYRRMAKESLRAHKVSIGLFLVGIVAALGTGVWMLAEGTLKESQAAAEGPAGD